MQKQPFATSHKQTGTQPVSAQWLFWKGQTHSFYCWTWCHLEWISLLVSYSAHVPPNLLSICSLLVAGWSAVGNKQALFNDSWNHQCVNTVTITNTKRGPTVVFVTLSHQGLIPISLKSRNYCFLQLFWGCYCLHCLFYVWRITVHSVSSVGLTGKLVHHLTCISHLFLLDSIIPGVQKIWIRTWGCSHNNSDGEYMAGQLAAYGYKITGNSMSEPCNSVFLGWMFRAVKLSANVFSLNYAFKNPLLIPFWSEGEEVECFPGIKQNGYRMRAFRMVRFSWQGRHQIDAIQCLFSHFTR